jgi:non-ribosomal peptide synthase protein (TIGR01720 family)
MPKAEVMFNYLGQFDQVMPVDGLFCWAETNGSGVPLHGPGGRRSHLLEIIGRVNGGRLHLEWIYSDRVYRQQTVEQLAQDFNDNLRALMRCCLSTGRIAVTPSDFPLARLGQSSIDEVLERLRKSRR